jgi:uncharacterized SAM-binding protein YcdF (DUF218 family)
LSILAWLVVSLLFNLAIKLPVNQTKPVDAIFVLGGSIRRELYAAQIAHEYSQLPILISQGSKEPCLWKIFQKQAVNLQRVWSEQCANSTFENFFFSVPILRHWGVHKVKLITSGNHLPRAKLLAKILLGSQGIAVEFDSPVERGVPGNNESTLKTILDVTRSLLWVLPSQIIQPPCFQVIRLSKVDFQAWEKQGFRCERQGRITP